MTDEGRADPLNARRPARRWAGEAALVTALIVGGIVAGAKLWQPVKKVEQRVADPIREAVRRASPLEDLPNLADAACPAVVALSLPDANGQTAQGVLIAADGHLVTTAPVPDDASVEALLNDGRRLPATVIARDPLSGVALLKLDGGDVPALALADPDLPRGGSWGFLLASPQGRGCLVAPGAIAGDSIAEGATGDYFLRAAVPGAAPAAGTPFLSAEGRVLGLARPADGGAPTLVPADLLAAVVGRLMRDAGAPPDPFGIVAEDLAPQLARRLGAARGRGAVIVLVGQGSAAATAGLQVGDIVLSAGGAPISSASELARAFGGGGEVPIVAIRRGEEVELTLKAGR